MNLPILYEIKTPPIYPISGKYTNKELDVSIIVPLYKSYHHVRKQIMTWQFETNLSCEIIYVDDKCPEDSKRAVYKSWNERNHSSNETIKLIPSKTNLGFGGACNLAAHQAYGKNLVFLNADTIVTYNWLKPIVELLEKPKVGIVGNLQLKNGGELDDTIDSAGSEWDWTTGNFLHIGRHIYKGEPLSKPMKYSEAPKDLLEVGEREMVTGCCFGIRKELFWKLGGFDQNYRKAYWEDSEICMAVQRAGYKVMFQPNSIIYHTGQHSGGKHELYESNRSRFFDKWVTSGFIDNIVREKRFMPPFKVSWIIVKRKEANGDVLVASAILKHLKEQHPGSKICFVTSCPWVLDGNPHVDKICSSMDECPNHQRVVDLDMVYERRPFTNILEAYMNEALVPNASFDLPVGEKEIEEKYVVFHTTQTAWVGRNWHRERFNKIALKVQEAGYKVVAIGAEDGHKVPCDYDMRKRMSVTEMATLIGNAELFIGIDSFPFHVAQFTKTPSVVFFGCVDPKTRIYSEDVIGMSDTTTPVTAHSGLTCLGCHHRKLPPSTVTDICIREKMGMIDSPECEDLVSVHQMWKTIEEKLKC